jgi:hypothetical protein
LARVNIDNIEREADRLLRQHGAFAGPNKVYTQAALIQRMHHGRECSLEEMCAKCGIEITIPPESVARIIGRAIRACSPRDEAEIWSMFEMGFDQDTIAAMRHISVRTVQRRLASARNRLRSDTNFWSEVFLAYRETLRRHKYHKPSARVPLPRELQAARAVLESRGYETMILVDKPTRVWLITESGKAEPLTWRQVVARAKIRPPRVRRGP